MKQSLLRLVSSEVEEAWLLLNDPPIHQQASSFISSAGTKEKSGPNQTCNGLCWKNFTLLFPSLLFLSPFSPPFIKLNKNNKHIIVFHFKFYFLV